MKSLICCEIFNTSLTKKVNKYMHVLRIMHGVHQPSPVFIHHRNQLAHVYSE